MTDTELKGLKEKLDVHKVEQHNTMLIISDSDSDRLLAMIDVQSSLDEVEQLLKQAGAI